jgi:hypothetical protein
MIQFENAIKHYKKMILDELKSENIICWVAGGSLRDYFIGSPTKTDHDLFFPSQTEYDKAKSYFISKNVEIKWESENGMKVVYNNRIYDLIKKFYSSPIDTINAFDFTICMLAVDDINVYHGETTFIDLAKHQLMINKITYPASTLSRAFRYYRKGFNMCKGEMKKIVESIQNMPKEEPTNIIAETTRENSNMSSGELNNYFFGID